VYGCISVSPNDNGNTGRNDACLTIQRPSSFLLERKPS
jgi:hypothetical protein